MINYKPVKLSEHKNILDMVLKMDVPFLKEVYAKYQDRVLYEFYRASEFDDDNLFKDDYKKYAEDYDLAMRTYAWSKENPKLFLTRSPDPLRIGTDNICAYFMVQDWLKWKRMYRISTDLSEVLVDSDIDKVDSEYFTNLPFDPCYIEFEGINDPAGVFVSICHNEAVKEPTGITINICAVRTGYTWFNSMLYIDIPFKGSKSLWEIVNESMVKDCSDDTKTWLFLILQSLVYLQSAKPDVEEGKEVESTVFQYSTKQHKAVRTTDKVRSWDVGFRFNVYDKNGKPASKADTDSTTMHAKKRPHVRKRHWHKYWCGPKGSQHLELRLIEMTYVNCNNSESIPVLSSKVV